MMPYHYSNSMLTPVIATCPGCEDLSLEFTNYPDLAERQGLRLRCQACQDFDNDSAAARIVAEAMSLPLIKQHMVGGCNDSVYVPCDECGETALECPGDIYAASLDGLVHESECCHTHGKISVDDDEGHAYIHFRRFTQRELDAGDDLLLAGESGDTAPCSECEEPSLVSEMEDGVCRECIEHLDCEEAMRDEELRMSCEEADDEVIEDESPDSTNDFEVTNG